MRFKVDENLPDELPHRLRAAGWDATSVVEEKLSGCDDVRIQHVCDVEDRILVTFDRGFANIRAYAPEDHPGFIVLRLRSQDKHHVLTVAGRLIAALRERELLNELWIVDESRIRVRLSSR
jgi:predicted nuclease of predicted toxin-antitoxin system